MELSYLQRWNQLRWQLARTCLLYADCLFNLNPRAEPHP